MMGDAVKALYEAEEYPPMSHPRSDPAMSAVAARMGGLEVPHPSGARVLEIGCATGHHLIPLALRWPGSEFRGMDLTESAVAVARERAAAAGARNVVFEAADLLDYEPAGGPYDFIIAHGFHSWVPDEVKAALFPFCRRHLSASGIATISFNVESGWAQRFPVVRKVRAIREARGGSLMEALEILRFVTEPGDAALAVIDDMLAKGEAVLSFDDFGPVNDPWPLERFARSAAEAGLRWLGETDPAENLPGCLADEVVERIAMAHPGTLEFLSAVDDAAGRTFRSGVLCRDDAPVSPRIGMGTVFEFAGRPGREPADGRVRELWEALRACAPCAVRLREVVEGLPEGDLREMATAIWEAIIAGVVLARIEPAVYEAEVPSKPRLGGFRRVCAEGGLPLVDAWHVPCLFPAGHYEVLRRMDGTRTCGELAAVAREHCPELAVEPWLRHLAARGMFSSLG